MLIVAQARSLTLLVIGVALVAAGQTSAFSTTFATVQAVLPGWVRGRGLATAMLPFQGATFIASLAWGALAGATSTSTALRVAAIVAACAAVGVIPIKLAPRATTEVAPLHAGAHAHHDVDDRSGPVLITARWRIDPAQAASFTAAMVPMRRLRRRTGALNWGLFEEVGDPGSFIEVFSVASWIEHERQYERPTVADGDIYARARVFLVDGGMPVTTHHVAAHTDRPSLHLHLPERLRHLRDDHERAEARATPGVG